MRKTPPKRHLSVVQGGEPPDIGPLTRAQVADRLGVSISTVRRYEGDRLHPDIGEDDVRLFDVAEVAELATELAAEPRGRRNGATASDTKPAPRSADEVAAQVFECLEQRWSLAEIVIGLRLAPARVRELHKEWCQGLVEGQLRMKRAVIAPLADDDVRIKPSELAARLSQLPKGLTRLSVARHRGSYTAPTPEGQDDEFSWVVELGGFHVSGPCEVAEITARYGTGDFRVTAYGFDPPAVRWEVVVENVGR